MPPLLARAIGVAFLKSIGMPTDAIPDIFKHDRFHVALPMIDSNSDIITFTRKTDKEKENDKIKDN